MTEVDEGAGGWLVYQWQWVLVHSVTGTRLPDEEFPSPHVRLAEQLMAYRDEVYGGRVDPTHVRFAFAPAGKTLYTAHLELYLPNMLGEFRDYEDAVSWAAGQDLHETKIVQRASKAHQELRSYGTKILASS